MASLVPHFSPRAPGTGRRSAVACELIPLPVEPWVSPHTVIATGSERSIEVGPDLVDVRQPDGEAHRAIGDVGGARLIRRQVRVAGRSRLDRAAAGIAEFGDAVEQLGRFSAEAA
ncbi:UNVERIFIED_ORG: hypothetical protein M2438_000301 [Methylobacterium sp. SuP10 SLI 274]|nr:hypothetical protein [Methylorubrum extorquens]MDF9789792.1 hypothetical protein [Methylorubrum extorquens]MDF9861500.1 hypothetical protein [Methylorubrum pseudosasae]MDH6635126.1 hypothetical protein [Methylobacterium sp. SuP10 SLI 274]MDH6664299.1 hypothetical protein [Methylorubrum zatmanii]